MSEDNSHWVHNHYKVTSNLISILILAYLFFKPILGFCIAAFLGHCLPTINHTVVLLICKSLCIKTYENMNKCKYQCQSVTHGSPKWFLLSLFYRFFWTNVLVHLWSLIRRAASKFTVSKRAACAFCKICSTKEQKII